MLEDEEAIINYKPISLVKPLDMPEWDESREKGRLLPYLKHKKGSFIPEIDLWTNEKILFELKDYWATYEEFKENKKTRPFKMAPRGWNIYITDERVFAAIERQKTVAGIIFTLPFKKRKVRNQLLAVHFPHSMLAAIIIRYRKNLECEHLALVYKQQKIYETSTQEAGRIVLGKSFSNHTFWIFDLGDRTFTDDFADKLGDTVHRLQQKLLKRAASLNLVKKEHMNEISNKLQENYEKGFNSEFKSFGKLRSKALIRTLFLDGLGWPLFPRTKSNNPKFPL
ncbi:MAG: hypothetical protein LUQ65_03930 [Candidatus Helarchaeota archaeon]|nr:hypothetical protein [Candidatus Helarchaeota archaeon]